MRAFRPAALAIVAILAGLAAALAPTASAESTPSAYASRLVQLINDARAQHGLRALTVTSGTSTVAANWTAHLASAGALSHNPNLAHDLETHGSPDWTSYGENVGEASSSSADQLFTAYMNSPEHRDNILGSSYRYLGVGVVFSGSTAWNTLDFVDQYASATSSSASSSSSSSTSTASHSSSPRVSHHVTRHVVTSAPKSAPRVVRHATPAAGRPAAVKHATVAHQPRRPATVKAVASTASTPAHRPTAADTAPATVAVAAAALRAPVHLPAPARDRLPILVATAAIVAVVAARFVVSIRAAAA